MIWHAAACLENYVFEPLWHELGMLGHASLGFLTEGPHAAACSRDLPNLAFFDSFLLLFARSLIFPLEHYLQDKNKHQMSKIGDKQYKTLSI